MEDKKEKMYLELRKINPKPNAKTYEISTVQDFFNVAIQLSKKDRKKMFKEFADSIEVTIHLNHAVAAISQEKTTEKLPKYPMPLIGYKWIND